MNDDSNCSLDIFIGRKLQSVEFIMDYVQLHFDGATITMLIWPSILSQENQYKYCDVKYRNVLCNLIGQQLSRIQIENGDKALLDFEGKWSLHISLKPSDYVGEEAILFRTDDDNQLWIW